MKKLFGHPKAKAVKLPLSTPSPNDDQSFHTPIYQQHAVHPVPQPLRSDSADDRWEVVPQSTDDPHLPQAPLQPSRGPSYQSLPPGASPPVPSPLAPRSPSPFNTLSNAPLPPPPPTKPPNNPARDRALDQGTKRRAPGTAALGILRALDPPRSDSHPHSHPKSQSEELLTQSDIGHGNYLPSTKDPGEKREKRSFWGREKDKDKPHDRERSERERHQTISRDKRDDEPELTRMIGYLTATSSEDWALVLEVCDRASSSEGNAKEAVRALRREFKYGEPPAQLAAARLWAIMLRNSSELFISQSTTRKFLDTIADLLTSQRTSPVVRERLLNVVAAAAYASGNGNSKDGFRGLWKKVKPADKPDEGVPFDTEDAMFSPSMPSRVSHYESEYAVTYPPVVPADIPSSPPPHKSPTRNRIIPPEEDIRRLFQECKIGKGNASLLSEALASSRPEELRKKDIVKEFYVKCRASQELIYAQIPWATAGAERSRVAKDQELQARKRTYSRESPNGPNQEPPHELTLEEKLLDALLAANTELLAALQQYDDLERVAMERRAEQQSRKETRMDRKKLQLLEHESTLSGEATSVAVVGGSSSRSPSPSSLSQSYSPPPSIIHTPFHHSDNSQTLAPPPAAPHGPRSPGHLSHHTRTPSPGTPNVDNPAPPSANGSDLQNGLSHLNIDSSRSHAPGDYGVITPVKPSAKALGKRRLVEPDIQSVHNRSGDSLFASEERSAADDRLLDSDSDDSAGMWNQRVNYVYDAAAERTQQRIRDGHNQLVNGVH